jgi:hypothetical protein
MKKQFVPRTTASFGLGRRAGAGTALGVRHSARYPIARLSLRQRRRQTQSDWRLVLWRGKRPTAGEGCKRQVLPKEAGLQNKNDSVEYMSHDIAQNDPTTTYTQKTNTNMKRVRCVRWEKTNNTSKEAEAVDDYGNYPALAPMTLM